jgi:hypothetical protein
VPVRRTAVTACHPPEAPDEPPALQLAARPLGPASGEEGAVGPPGAEDRGAELGEDGSGVLPGARDGPTERAVAGPGVAVESAERGNDLRPDRVQVEVADEFQQVGLFLHHDGFIAVLESMPDPLVAAVEGPSVPRQKGAHAAGQGPRPGADQQMGMIGEERPGIDDPGSRLGEGFQTRDEIAAVGVVPKDSRPLDPPHHHMMQSVRGIQAGLAGHGAEDLSRR